VNGHNIDHRRYADYIHSPDMQTVYRNYELCWSDKVVEESKEYGLSLNKAKAKCMVISKSNTERRDLKIFRRDQ